MKQFLIAFINIIVATITLVSISMIQIEFPDNKSYNDFNSLTFEKTDEFTNILNKRYNEIFSLISLKKAFEVNNELNYSNIVAETLDESNGMKKWTLNECLELAKKHGLMIDKDYDIVMSETNNQSNNVSNPIYNFIFKLYPSNVRTGAQSEIDFLSELMKSLSDYHKMSKDLSSNSTNFHYNVSFLDNDNGQVINYSNTNISAKELLDSNAFIFLSSKENIVSSNIDSITSQTLKYAKQNNPHPDKSFNLYCAVDTNYPVNDSFKIAYDKYNYTKNRYGVLLTTSTFSGIVFIISFIIYLMIIFTTEKNIKESSKLFFKIPTEFYIILYIFVTAMLILFINQLSGGYKPFGYDFSTTYTNFYILAVYATSILLSTTLVTKYANDSLTLFTLNLINEDSDNSDLHFNSNSMFIGILVPILIFIIISVYQIYIYTTTGYINSLILGLFIFVATLCFVIYIFYLKNAFNKALDVQIKSNEMRSSLIANVSHDIKTPLTSILNYTQIITDEIENPDADTNKNLLHYSEIIANKSNRLNELINDLIFDSKVRAGNVDLDMQKIDLNAFISQVMVEFEDRLKEKDLKIIYDNKTDHSYIKADSTQLYRVFQNLFSNIYKYALENSRVYIDLENIKSKLTVTIKNIQKERIDVNIDTLKNRFVRGDKSRNTEGFGLGLSIADSLVSSMNGQLDIESLRDQFIAKITFMAYDE